MRYTTQTISRKQWIWLTLLLNGTIVACLQMLVFFQHQPELYLYSFVLLCTHGWLNFFSTVCLQYYSTRIHQSRILRTHRAITEPIPLRPTHSTRIHHSAKPYDPFSEGA